MHDSFNEIIDRLIESGMEECLRKKQGISCSETITTTMKTWKTA